MHLGFIGMERAKNFGKMSQPPVVMDDCDAVFDRA